MIPNGLKNLIKKNLYITELHEKICKELSEYNYKGIVVYSGFNEPMLNKKCFENILRTRNYLPQAKIELITNGDVLNLKNIKKLFDAGLTTLLISVYDGPEDLEKFKNMCVEAKLKPNQYVIRNRFCRPSRILVLLSIIEVVTWIMQVIQ